MPERNTKKNDKKFGIHTGNAVNPDRFILNDRALLLTAMEV